MIKIINSVDDTGIEYQLKVFKDENFSNIEILLPMDYSIYIVGKNNSIIWESNEDLSSDIIQRIKTHTIIIVNKNPSPGRWIKFDYNDKKHDLECLKHMVRNCQHLSIGISPDKHLINVEYCYLLNARRSKDNSYMMDHIDLIADDEYNGYNLGYEEF